MSQCMSPKTGTCQQQKQHESMAMVHLIVLWSETKGKFKCWWHWICQYWWNYWWHSGVVSTGLVGVGSVQMVVCRYHQMTFQSSGESGVFASIDKCVSMKSASIDPIESFAKTKQYLNELDMFFQSNLLHSSTVKIFIVNKFSEGLLPRLPVEDIVLLAIRKKQQPFLFKD